MCRRIHMDRGRLVNEILRLLPTLMRIVERPSPVEMGEIPHHGIPTDVQFSPGHIQVLIALTRGPRSVGQLAEELEVSPPAATQLVDRLAEHGMVERHNDPEDRRGVLRDSLGGPHEAAGGLRTGERRGGEEGWFLRSPVSLKKKKHVTLLSPRQDSTSR